MRAGIPAFAGLLALAAKLGQADPTWPAPTDEMEEIIFQLQGFKGRLFNDQIFPCNNEAAGTGRVTASEWLRIGFQYVLDINPLSWSEQHEGVQLMMSCWSQGLIRTR